MRILQYEALLKLDYSEIRQITESDQSFVVIVDCVLSERIQKFLANEREFQLSPKKLRDRIRYVFGATHALRLPNLMPLWNRAMMAGFTVYTIKSAGICEIVFRKE